jgi:hypothetical protein
MSTIRIALRRLLDGVRPDEPAVHFHHRGETPEPCFDRHCPLPRLNV